MTGRQKIEAAFSPGGSPGFAAVIPYEDLYVRDSWHRVTSCPWWWRHEPSIDRQLRWRAQAHAAMGHDWAYLPLFHPRAHREHTRIEETNEGVFAVDVRDGVRTQLFPPEPGGWARAGAVQSVHPSNPPDTIDDIDSLIPPPEPNWAESVVEDGRADLARAVLADFGRDLYPIGQVSTPLWNCYGLWGFEGLMERVIERPELVKHACARFLDLSVAGAQVAAALGARGIWMEECLTDQIGPEAFAELHLPFLRRLVDAIRELGLHSIYYFCGNPAGKWDLILSAGADALALEEGKKGFSIDIEDVVDRVGGRCAVLGNLDAIGVLQDGSEESLRAEIHRQAAAGRRNGGRFVMSLGSPATPDTPPERLRLYCDLVREA